MEVTEGRLKTRGCDLLRVVRKLQPITVVLVLIFQELTRSVPRPVLADCS